MSTAYLDHDGPIALAHRGFSVDGLENSLRAFRDAVALGCTHLETDVHATSDGQLVAFHDTVLDHLTDARGAVTDLPWSQVSQARIRGVEPIPLFEQVVEELPQARFNVDIKTPGAIEPFAAIVERMGLHDRVCVASFSDKRRRAVLRRLTRPVTTSAGMTVAGAWTLASAVGIPALVRAALRDVDVLQVPVKQGPIPVVTRRAIRAAHAAGKQVHVWTINEPAEMERLLDLGVDGLVSDRADLALDAIRARRA